MISWMKDENCLTQCSKRAWTKIYFRIKRKFLNDWSVRISTRRLKSEVTVPHHWTLHILNLLIKKILCKWHYWIFQEADPIPDKYDIVVQVKACALSLPNTKVNISIAALYTGLIRIWNFYFVQAPSLVYSRQMSSSWTC